MEEIIITIDWQLIDSYVPVAYLSLIIFQILFWSKYIYKWGIKEQIYHEDLTMLVIIGTILFCWVPFSFILFPIFNFTIKIICKIFMWWLKW